jgi:hypothetical protein
LETIEMSTRLRLLAATLGGALLISGSLLGTVAPVAAASSPTTATGPCAAERTAYSASETVANGIALGDCMIGQRLTYLSKASSRLPGIKNLTDADRAALATILSTDTTGLTGLKATLDAETTLAAVQSDLAAIVSDYRVFALAARQVTLVSEADAVSATVARYATVNTRLEARIQAAAAKGRNTSAASAELAVMNRTVARAASDVSGLSARLLALTPAEYDAGSARPVLVRAETALLRARAQLLDARADALRVLIRLR